MKIMTIATLAMGIMACVQNNYASAAEEQRQNENLPRIIRIEHKDAIQVTGLVLHTSFQNGQNEKDVPPFFHRVLEEHLLDRVPNRINQNQLCVFLMKKDSPAFDYVMGVEVENGARIPSEMEHLMLPASDYAVLTIIKRGPQDVGSGFAYIYEEWLPTSDYRPANAPCFIYYDDRFFSIFNQQGYAGNPIAELYVPIQPKE